VPNNTAQHNSAHHSSAKHKCRQAPKIIEMNINTTKTKQNKVYSLYNAINLTSNSFRSASDRLASWLLAVSSRLRRRGMCWSHSCSRPSVEKSSWLYGCRLPAGTQTQTHRHMSEDTNTCQNIQIHANRCTDTQTQTHRHMSEDR
jgi:hypothetical protein